MRVTAVNEAGATARRAAHSKWLERTTRVGLIGYGVTHLIVGWIALQLAFGKAPTEGDQNGAFKTLATQPAGKWLLVLVAIGLIAMTVWQVLAAAVGHVEERGRSRTIERVGSAAKAVFYGYLAFKAIAVVQGSRTSAPDQQQQRTNTMLDSTGGRWLVGLIGLAVLAVGIGMIWYGVTKRFEKHLRTGQMSAAVRKAARTLGVVGYAAKGTVYGTLGILVLIAALNHDPGKSRGLDQALRTLAAQPAGDVVLIGVAVGIAAFGVFCVFQAKYRRI
jgi:hypothetical protein